MSLSRKQLKEIKNKLQEKDQNALSKIRNSKSQTVRQVKTTIKNESYQQQTCKDFKIEN